MFLKAMRVRRRLCGMAELTYMQCKWLHDADDLPIEIWSEIGTDRYEVRKLEYFRDGTVGFACAEQTTEHKSGTRLGDQAVPPFHEIAREPEFKPRSVTSEDFEKRWQRRRDKWVWPVD